MNDKELLELAAKAAGMKSDGPASRYVATADPRSLLILNDRGGHTIWNPLEDDGDAMRLAVKLGLLIDCDNVLSEVEAVLIMHGHDDDYVRMGEPYGNDPYAATRRAIVRAAAEIGKLTPSAPSTDGGGV